MYLMVYRTCFSSKGIMCIIKAKRLLSSLGIRTPLSNIPGLTVLF